MSTDRPPLAELRAVCQPASLMGRRSAEHWAGRLYMRRTSLHVTRYAIDWPVTPNQLTVAMMAVGFAGALVATVPAFWSALVAALAVQVYLLLDCVDGEVARWRRTTSTAGVFLDRLGHYVVEVSLLAAVGIRADGGLDSIGGWTTLGLLAGILAAFGKLESDLVTVARASAGEPIEVSDGAAQPDPGLLRRLRRGVARLPFHRLLGGVELSLALVVVAAVDAARGDLVATRALTATTVAVGVVVAVGHAVITLRSGRLR